MVQSKADKLSAEAERCPFASQSEVDGLLPCWIFATVMSLLAFLMAGKIFALGGFADATTPNVLGELSIYGAVFMLFAMTAASLSACASIYILTYSGYYGFEDKVADWIWRKEPPGTL